MPIVKSYTRQVSPEAAPVVERSQLPGVQLDTPQIRHTATPEDKGSELTGTLGRIGAQMMEAQRVKAENAKLDSVTRSLQDWELNALYAKDGLLQKQGQDAVGSAQKVEEDFQKFTGEQRSGLGSDRLRSAYDDLVAQRHNQIMVQAYRHENDQAGKFQMEELASTIANHQSLAGLNANDPLRVSDEVNGIREAAAKLAKLQGFGPEQTQELIGGNVSKAHLGVIDGLLAKGQDVNAETYFKARKDEFTAGDRAKVERALEVGSTLGEASRAAGKIWADLGPKSDTDVVSQDVLSNKARDMFPDDPKRAAATIQELRQRKSDFDEGRRDRKDATESTVWQMALAGMPLADIQRTSEYRALPGDKQREISEHVADRMYTLGQRAQSAADYLRTEQARARTEREHAEDEAYQRESRAYTREQRAKQEKETKSYAVYEEILSDPEAFSRMSENAIINKLPELGRTLTNDLLSKRKEMNPKALRNASIDGDLFNSVAEDAGLQPFKNNKTDEDKARLGALRKYVLDQIDQRQGQGKGVELNREEKRGVMEKALFEVVPANEPWLWFNTPAKRAFEVKIGDIPQADRQRIETALRGAKLPYTEQDVVDAFVEQQERAKK
jgi:hypothetical protein